MAGGVGGTAAAVPAAEKGDGCRRGGCTAAADPAAEKGDGCRQGVNENDPYYSGVSRSKGRVGT
jgi:hypothetical protein